MSMLTDPEMEEVIIDFCSESGEIYDQIEAMLEEYEDEPSPDKLEKFGQTIDRVMGAAKSIDAHQSGMYCELGKTISYKASQCDDQQLLDIVVAVLFDTVDILKSMNKNIIIEKEEKVDGVNLEVFASRLQWLAEKFKNITRSSVSVGSIDESTDMNQKSIDDILKDLGL
jgi:chemotaxis protein histidine kinase CheA